VRQEDFEDSADMFSDAQKAFILKQGADGVPVADICRKAGISQATSKLDSIFAKTVGICKSARET